MLKCRDKYMSDVYQKIDRYKIETMKQLSKQKFDDVQVRPEDDKKRKAQKAERLWKKNRNNSELKISKLHRTFLKIESLATKNNILMLFVAACFFTVYILPFILYSIKVVDSHYLGWLHEPMPYFAKTTDEKLYYTSQNIPFMTVEDIHQEKRHHLRRLA